MEVDQYRTILKSEFERRQLKNPHYSMRSFARDLEVFPSVLSEVFNNKKGISITKARFFCKKLNLDKQESRIFLLSVSASHARSKTERENSSIELHEAIKQLDSPSERVSTVVGWVHSAIYKLSQQSGITLSGDVLSKRLGVSKFIAVDALRFLKRLGFVSDKSNQKSYLAHRGKGKELNIDQSQVIGLAQQKLQFEERGAIFVHEPLLLDQDGFEKAQNEILKCIKRIKKIENKTKKAKLFFLSSQLFGAEKKELK